ncbi:MAG TPA: SgcJ/EcaC family oxidoreductase [Myxococcota bacterium]|nr:SgcJ/EcaC family oxidoreductase [Myxococcota bacterium]
MAAAPRTPEECDQLFGEYASAGDLDGLLSLYEPEASLAGPDGSVAVGHEAIRAALASFAGGSVAMHMNVVKVVRGGDLAVLTNEWRATGRSPDGSPLDLRGCAVEVVRRQPDGTWRFVVDDPYADSR